MKTISIRLEDSIYDELEAMLNDMGQTKQTFYETYTRTALRERRIPFIIRVPLVSNNSDSDIKKDAFADTIPSVTSMIKEQFDMEMQKGMDDITAGRVSTIDSVEEENKCVLE